MSLYEPKLFVQGEMIAPTQKSELVTTKKSVLFEMVKPHPIVDPGVPKIAPFAGISVNDASAAATWAMSRTKLAKHAILMTFTIIPPIY